MAKDIVVTIPEMTRDVIERLKKSFGVTTDAEVLSRALGLANTAIEVAGDKKVVTLSGDTAAESVRVTLDK